MKTEWRVVEMHDVMDYFVKGFKPKSNGTICNWETWIDKGQVVFRLFISEEKKDGDG